MKPRETAKMLMKKFDNSHKYALICVDEIISGMNISAHGAAWELEVLIKKEDFWYKVRDEIKHII